MYVYIMLPAKKVVFSLSNFKCLLVFFFFFFSVWYFEMLGIKLCKELKLNGCFEGTILIISNFRVERALLRIARFYRFGFSFPYLFIYDWFPDLGLRWLYLYMLVLFLLNTKRALSSCCFFAAHIYLHIKICRSTIHKTKKKEKKRKWI